LSFNTSKQVGNSECTHAASTTKLGSTMSGDYSKTLLKNGATIYVVQLIFVNKVIKSIKASYVNISNSK